MDFTFMLRKKITNNGFFLSVKPLFFEKNKVPRVILLKKKRSDEIYI